MLCFQDKGEPRFELGTSLSALKGCTTELYPQCLLSEKLKLNGYLGVLHKWHSMLFQVGGFKRILLFGWVEF